MAQMQEMLPEDQLKKLLDLRDSVQYSQPPAERIAAQAAAQADKASAYDKLFSPVADIDAQIAPKLADKSAADSASVLSKAADMDAQLAPSLANKSAADSASVLSKAADMDAALAPKLAGKSAAESANVMSKVMDMSDQLAPKLANKDAFESAKTLAEVPKGLGDVAAEIAEAMPKSGLDAMNKLGQGVKSFAEAPIDYLSSLIGSPEGQEAANLAGKASRILGPLGLARDALASEKGPTDQDEADLISKAKAGGKFFNGQAMPDKGGIALPNGGLEGQALADYIKAHPGPQATTGNNPNNPNPTDDDGSISTVNRTPAVLGPAKVASPGKGPSDSDADSDSSSQPAAKPVDPVKALLDKIYGADGNDDALKRAQEMQRQQLIGAQFQRAGNTFANALSKGAFHADDSFANSMEKNASLPVEQILQQRKGQMDKLDMGVKLSDLNDKQLLRDPNSAVSSAYRSFAAQAAPKLANDPNFKNLDAEGVKQLLPGIDMMMKTEMLKLQKQTLLQNHQEDKWNKAEQDLGKGIEGLYSPRGAAGRAAVIKQSADRLLGYAAQFANRNDLTKQEVELLVKDMGQIMSGGVATEGSSKRIMPATLESSFKDLIQRATNNPTGANLSEFVKRLENSAKVMRNEADKYESTHVNNLVDMYQRSLRPDTYKALKTKYNGGEVDGGSAGGASSSAPASGKVRVTNGAETYDIDPSDLPHAMQDGFKKV